MKINLTPYLRSFSHYRYNQRHSGNPQQKQIKTLLNLVKKAQNTRFGTQHNFSSIETIEDYQTKVPLRKYEDFWEEYWKDTYPTINNITWPGKIEHFCVSSGTSSGRTKYIPCTKEMIESNSKCGLELLCHHTYNNFQSEVLKGKSFFLGGSTALSEEAPGIFCGDLSGIQAAHLPWWAKFFYFPPKELALLSDWEEKIDTLARAALKENIRIIGGVPSWLLIFFDKVFEIAGVSDKKLRKVFPELEMLVHGGVNFEPYRNQFQELLQGSRAETREVYPASEGFIAIADRGHGEGLHLNLFNDIFYEFVPVEELESEQPTRHWIGNVVPDVNYAIVLTTCAGLWSYVLGDTVKFVDTAQPRLLVSGRTSYMLSAFGEHLIASEIESSIAKAAAKIDNDIADYSVGPVFPNEESSLGGHIYIVEFKSEVSQSELVKFRNILDETLSEKNEDYEAHRAEGFGLNLPAVTVVKEGTFGHWMKSRDKLGGQNKVPRIINDQELLENLLNFSKSRTLNHLES